MKTRQLLHGDRLYPLLDEQFDVLDALGALAVVPNTNTIFMLQSWPRNMHESDNWDKLYSALFEIATGAVT